MGVEHQPDRNLRNLLTWKVTLVLGLLFFVGKVIFSRFICFSICSLPGKLNMFLQHPFVVYNFSKDFHHLSGQLECFFWFVWI